MRNKKFIIYLNIALLLVLVRLDCFFCFWGCVYKRDYNFHSCGFRIKTRFSSKKKKFADRLLAAIFWNYLENIF